MLVVTNPHVAGVEVLRRARRDEFSQDGVARPLARRLLDYVATISTALCKATCPAATVPPPPASYGNFQEFYLKQGGWSTLPWVNHTSVRAHM